MRLLLYVVADLQGGDEATAVAPARVRSCSEARAAVETHGCIIMMAAHAYCPWRRAVLLLLQTFVLNAFVHSHDFPKIPLVPSVAIESVKWWAANTGGQLTVRVGILTYINASVF